MSLLQTICSFINKYSQYTTLCETFLHLAALFAMLSNKLNVLHHIPARTHTHIFWFERKVHTSHHAKSNGLKPYGYWYARRSHPLTPSPPHPPKIRFYFGLSLPMQPSGRHGFSYYHIFGLALQMRQATESRKICMYDNEAHRGIASMVGESKWKRKMLVLSWLAPYLVRLSSQMLTTKHQT